jgi:solute carrier family 35 (UDP-sugar transporter), member A1/2/3
MKILTTAMFSVIILHRSLSKLKWVSLVILTCGVALVSLATSNATATKESNFVGLTAVITACILSGLAGVWYGFVFILCITLF